MQESVSFTYSRSEIINILVISIALLFILFIHQDTFLSIKALWDSSDTYAHGYIIFPIAFYLIWGKRADLYKVPPSFSLFSIVAVIICTLIWFLATLVDVQIIKQYSAVSLIPLVFLAFWGWSRIRVILFPLLFMLLSVPFGEAYVPYMITWVGDFVVIALELTGIPVFREGNMLSLPSGEWSVVDACSGLRYLIASITLGCLYAYLMYRSFWRRTLFITFSIVVPIFANWVRAYMIIMIGHLSGMELAVGVDHIIYGWFFFGIVIGLMFYIGTFWREDLESENSSNSINSQTGHKIENNLTIRLVMVFILFSGAVFSGPWLKSQAELLNNTDYSGELVLPDVIGSWKKTNTSPWSWEPHFSGADIKKNITYSNGVDNVTIYIEYYASKKEGSELISSQNILVKEKDKNWRSISAGNTRIEVSSNNIPFKQNILKSFGKKLYVWSTYWIADQYEINPYIGKIMQAKSLLLGPGTESSAIMIATDFTDDEGEAKSRLKAFSIQAIPFVQQAMESARGKESSLSGRLFK